MNDNIKIAIKYLNLAENYLLKTKEYYHCEDIKQIISKLENQDDEIRLNNNSGQVNITSGNGQINATQNNRFKL